jgi:hypothetical protein
MNELNEYIGAIHIHSTYSDGTRPVSEIIEIAQQSGLDFMVLTDHFTLQPKRDGYEGWHDDLLVLVGYETADPEDNNHYLILDVDEEVSDGRSDPDEYLNGAKAAGGIGIIAHPDEERTNPKHRPYPWKRWETEDFIGLEIWNYMSEWMEHLEDYNAIYNFVFPEKVVKYAPQRTLERWDRLNQKRFVPAIGGIDVHEHHHKILGIFRVLIFPYERLFKRIRTHILTDTEFTKTLEKDKEVVYNCIVQGSSFISNYYRGNAKGFRFYVEKDRRRFYSGSTLELNGAKLMLNIDLPLSGKIRLIKDGNVISEKSGKNYAYPIKESGVYRVEVFRKGGAWIYSNPISVL